ncbi:substrate-binding domain-containing protein [Leifsonia aquatica]|uniref:Transcriptional regulator, DeoR family n=2 Tax=Leifsonia aquatica TaxID=144185 RepID=U2R2N1_LEIAQ|nr:substrate-binding domain-containing protein [Leifsonia aquatica]ERK69505.1 transcriptional regulator, DeoR family [Leifsonia aquatica ATCC 14665]MBB2968536.1 DNA-binding LacI/PurR family transcriptional regulator [Leifsonia aquatica]
MTNREPLYSVQRRERIMDQLRERGAVSVSVLASELGVSELTVRRDINTLAQQGLVTRVHGGATLRSSLDTGTRSSAAPMATKYTIGMVVPSLEYYWPPIVHGARAQAAQLRASLLLRASTYDSRDNRRQVEALLKVPGLHGLIVAPDTLGDDAIETLRWLDSLPVPVVLAERRVRTAAAARRLDSVVSDHTAGASLAVHHLHEVGHTRIGLFIESESPTGRYVRRGWQSALASLDLPTDVAMLQGIRFDSPGREEAMDEALDLCRRTGTTAVIVLPDPHAIALEQHALDRGVRVPHDLAIVAYDDDVARFGDPAITAVRPPKEFVGREAVNLLIARLEGGSGRPAYRVKLSPELHVRQSTLPVSIADATVLDTTLDTALDEGDETA